MISSTAIGDAPIGGAPAVAAVPGFSMWDIGNCNCTGVCLVTICVQACTTSTNIPNAVVTIKDGATVIATGVTSDPGGCVTLDIVTAGTYTIVITNVNCFADYTTSRAMACGGTHFINVSSTCCGPIPIPGTLYLTDSNTTLTFTPALSSQSYTVSHSNAVGVLPGPPVHRDCANPGTYLIRVHYSITCIYTTSFGIWQFNINRFWDMACTPRRYCVDGTSSSEDAEFNAVASFNLSTPCPISWSGTLTPGVAGTDPVGGTVVLSA